MHAQGDRERAKAIQNRAALSVHRGEAHSVFMGSPPSMPCPMLQSATHNFARRTLKHAIVHVTKVSIVGHAARWSGTVEVTSVFRFAQERRNVTAWHWRWLIKRTFKSCCVNSSYVALAIGQL